MATKRKANSHRRRSISPRRLKRLSPIAGARGRTSPQRPADGDRSSLRDEILIQIARREGSSHQTAAGLIESEMRACATPVWVESRGPARSGDERVGCGAEIVMKHGERIAPVAACIAALSTLVCCLPLGFAAAAMTATASMSRQDANVVPRCFCGPRRSWFHPTASRTRVR